MEVVHQLGKVCRRKEGSGHFLLTNKKGNFLSLGCPNVSDFDGLFYHDSRTRRMVKILHDLKVQGQVRRVINHFSWTERETASCKERFFLSSNACIYEVDKACEPILEFDCKYLYDNDDQGRDYTTAVEGNRASLQYTKQNQDGSTYSVFVKLAAEALNNETGNTSPRFEKTGRWKPAAVPYDGSRNMPGERFVFDAFRLISEGPARMVITFSLEEGKAEEKLRYVLENQDAVIDGIMKYPLQRFSRHGGDIDLSLACNALDSLVTKLKGQETRGIFAGLPWFMQYWGRDEATTLGAFIVQEQYMLVKEICSRLLQKVAEGQLAAHEGAGQISIDEPGIFCLRLTQLLRKLREQKSVHQFFTQDELTQLRTLVKGVLEQLKPHRDLHGFLASGPRETWMDTWIWGDPGRPGVRVEIQALMLCVYDCLIELGETNKRMIEERNELAKLAKEWFFDARGYMRDGYFPDGAADERVRPNLFLAWYYQPGLLSKEEWRDVFDHALGQLWLDWGGLASLGKDDPMFHDRHTGLGDASYHRGDSWFFVNNIAAIALFSIDPHRYEKQIKKILAASLDNLLWKGYIGHVSELSDAAEANAKGCWAQAWSAATLVELLHSLKSL